MKLTELPESIGQLTQLTSLDLSRNQLTSLPDSLGQLTQLTELNLSNNQLTALPDWLGQLTQLTSLYLHNNQLTALPDTLGQLTWLISLSIFSNPLKSLPDSFAYLTQLEELLMGNGDNNKETFERLPDCIAKLTNLLYLDCGNCQFTELPDWIGDLKKLEQIKAYRNKISKIPSSIAQLEHLETLRLDDNPLNPTLQIIYDACKKHDTKHEDYESLFAYLRSLEGNVEPLYETKLMFQRKLKVFLCHASQDKPIVHQLYEKLVVEGWIEPWLDAKKLLPGQDWQTEIKNAVETADNVIIFLSNTSINKDGFIQKELRLAKDIAMEKTEDSIFLIPLRLEDCEVPKSFRHYHWVNYFGNEQEQTYKKLLESLKLRLNK